MLSIFLLRLSTLTRAIVMVHLFNGSVLVLMTRGQILISMVDEFGEEESMESR
jgi:hypothetical protein